MRDSFRTRRDRRRTLASDEIRSIPASGLGDEPGNVAVFDARAFVKRLTAAGMPEAQAEAMANEQMRLIDERLTTKQDVAKSEPGTKAEIVSLAASTQAEIANFGRRDQG